MSELSDDRCINLVIFRAGGFLIGVEARYVRASQGAAAEGAPLAETVLGLPNTPQAAGARQRLTLELPDQEGDILVTSPLELVNMPISNVHPLPPLLTARNYLLGLRALLLHPRHEIVLLFDVRALRFN